MGSKRNGYSDTVMLLRECNAGIKMGEDAIKELLPHTRDGEMKRALELCKDTHAALGDETHKMLLRFGADTKDAHPVARIMSHAKIKMRMMMKGGDREIAALMTDGCDMGIKSLNKYLNEYTGAVKDARALAARIIASEESLEAALRAHL